VNVTNGQPVARQESTRTAAESWFLDRGLPMVLPTRARWRRLWQRSAPILAAYATLQAGCVLPVYLITRRHDVEITGKLTTGDLVVLAIVALTLPVMTIAGWLVSRMRKGRTRAVVAAIAVAVVACVGVVMSGAAQLPMDAVVVALALLLTASGALTFMDISARAAGDAEYRSTFLDPLIDDLHTALIARNRYRGAVAITACDVDAADRQ
jgi:MFS family permease